MVFCSNLKRYVHPNVHSSTVHNSQDRKQPECPLTDEWIKKLWYIYAMEYYSDIKRNAFESVPMRWMDLELIIQSEVKKRKTNIIINAYRESLERWYWRSYLQGSKRDADIKDRLLVTVDRGEGGMTGESISETYTLPYVKYSQWEFAVWCRKPKASALW